MSITDEGHLVPFLNRLRKQLAGHHTFSIYITAPRGSVWGTAGAIDHNITKVVSGVATTALLPELGADETRRVLAALIAQS